MRIGWLGLLAFFASNADAHAGSKLYHDVRTDVGITGAFADINSRSGAGMAVEIKGYASDNLAIGGRIEFAVMFGGVLGADEAPVKLAIAASGILKAEYLFGKEFVRPFIGFGVGGYTVGGQTIAAGPNQDGISSSTGRYFGVAPQLGVDIGRVRVAATYNAILGATLELRQTIGTVETTDKISQNYLSLELSFQFAGGKKQTPSSVVPPAETR